MVGLCLLNSEYVYLYGDFLKWGYRKWMIFEGKIQGKIPSFEMMTGGTPSWHRKPPYVCVLWTGNSSGDEWHSHGSHFSCALDPLGQDLTGHNFHRLAGKNGNQIYRANNAVFSVLRSKTTQIPSWCSHWHFWRWDVPARWPHCTVGVCANEHRGRQLVEFPTFFVNICQHVNACTKNVQKIYEKYRRFCVSELLQKACHPAIASKLDMKNTMGTAHGWANSCD